MAAAKTSKARPMSIEHTMSKTKRQRSCRRYSRSVAARSSVRLIETHQADDPVTQPG